MVHTFHNSLQEGYLNFLTLYYVYAAIKTDNPLYNPPVAQKNYNPIIPEPEIKEEPQITEEKPYLRRDTKISLSHNGSYTIYYKVSNVERSDIKAEEIKKTGIAYPGTPFSINLDDPNIYLYAVMSKTYDTLGERIGEIFPEIFGKIASKTYLRPPPLTFGEEPAIIDSFGFVNQIKPDTKIELKSPVAGAQIRYLFVPHINPISPDEVASRGTLYTGPFTVPFENDNDFLRLCAITIKDAQASQVAAKMYRLPEVPHPMVKNDAGIDPGKKITTETKLTLYYPGAYKIYSRVSDFELSGITPEDLAQDQYSYDGKPFTITPTRHPKPMYLYAVMSREGKGLSAVMKREFRVLYPSEIPPQPTVTENPKSIGKYGDNDLLEADTIITLSSPPNTTIYYTLSSNFLSDDFFMRSFVNKNHVYTTPLDTNKLVVPSSRS